MARATDDTTTTPSRRSLLGGLGCTVIPFPGAKRPPASPIDPIFQAIARHKLAEDCLGVVLSEIDERPDILAEEAAWAAVRDTGAALIDTVPTTREGVAAMIWYISENERIGNHFAVDAVRESIARTATAAFARLGSIALDGRE